VSGTPQPEERQFDTWPASSAVPSRIVRADVGSRAALRGRARLTGVSAGCALGILCCLASSARGYGASLLPPAPNKALLDAAGGERLFVGTVGKPWTSGRFGCVRSEGGQMHEGIDIRCVERDSRGEPRDVVRATAPGVVAYVSRRPALSNFGNYIVLRHDVDGLELYSLYAHLSEVRAALRAGVAVQGGEALGVMGRTSNTRQAISKERAHLHFELGFLVNDQFPRWYARTFPGQRNDHGVWNGQNLAGLDPHEVFVLQGWHDGQFNLRRYVQTQPELCRVLVPQTSFPWLRRYRELVVRNPRAEREGVAAYEVALNFNGLAFQLVPRAASELAGRGGSGRRLLSVNESEQARRPCRKLVSRRGGRWELTAAGNRVLDLLVYGGGESPSRGAGTSRR
jgi:murein DD-endopeptidase MepM/ murein hydrolase activator NlpD